MKRESVIISSFIIDNTKQVKHFQIRIPRETKNIIGVEMGMIWLSGIIPPVPIIPQWELPISLRRNLFVGEVKLQSYEKANMFYTEDLVINKNIDAFDFTSGQFAAKNFTHQTVANEDEIIVDGNSTILQGVYKDKLSEIIDGNYKYKVNLYLWMETKEN